MRPRGGVRIVSAASVYTPCVEHFFIFAVGKMPLILSYIIMAVAVTLVCLVVVYFYQGRGK